MMAASSQARPRVAVAVAVVAFAAALVAAVTSVAAVTPDDHRYQMYDQVPLVANKVRDKACMQQLQLGAK